MAGFVSLAAVMMRAGIAIRASQALICRICTGAVTVAGRINTGFAESRRIAGIADADAGLVRLALIVIRAGLPIVAVGTRISRINA